MLKNLLLILFTAAAVAAAAPKVEIPTQVTAVRTVQSDGKDQYPMTGQVLLTLAENVTSLPLRIFVSLDLLGGAVKDWQPGAGVKKFVSSCSAPPAAPPAPGAATTPSAPPPAAHRGFCDYSQLGFFKPKKGEENVSLTGAWTAGYSTRPLYTIDAIIELPLCPAKKFDFNIGGTIKTAERRTIDPDSFTAYLSFKPKSAIRYPNSTTWYGTWDVRGGGEFSRKVNLKTSFSLPNSLPAILISR